MGQREILDAWLKLRYRNYNKIYQYYFNKERAEDDKNDKELKDSAAMHLTADLPPVAYTGKYFSEVYGDMQVVLEKGELRMRFSHHPDMYALLQSLGGNRFYAIFTDPEFSRAVFPFTVENGKVRSVTVKVADFVEYTPYEFAKIQ